MLFEGPCPAKVTIRTHAGGLDIAYVIDGERVEQRIRLRATPCHYGGARLWFECPHCRRRVALLYLSRRVACRRCFGLAYPSQSEGVLDRLWRRQGKVEARMASGRRMTRATRERLEDELAGIVQARNRLLLGVTRRFLHRFMG